MIHGCNMNINLKNTTKDGVVTIHTFSYKDNGSYFSTGNFEIYKNGELVRNISTGTDRVLTPNNKNHNGNGNGYKQLCLTIDGKLFNYPIHKWLMVMDYKGQTPEGFEVDHEDGNIHNNDISNLRIVTHEYNRNKGYKKLVDSAMSKFFIK